MLSCVAGVGTRSTRVECGACQDLSLLWRKMTAQQDPAWQVPGSPEVALREAGALLDDRLGKLGPPEAALYRVWW